MSDEKSVRRSTTIDELSQVGVSVDWDAIDGVGNGLCRLTKKYDVRFVVTQMQSGKNGDGMTGRPEVLRTLYRNYCPEFLADAKAALAVPEPEPTPKPEPKPQRTVSQENALETAADYLDYSAFSRSGLIEQLEYEGYSTQDATFAVDNLNVDWNQQAAKTAKDYLDYSSYSRSGLVEQLVYEGYTREQAEYGVNKTGL